MQEMLIGLGIGFAICLVVFAYFDSKYWWKRREY